MKRNFKNIFYSVAMLSLAVGLGACSGQKMGNAGGTGSTGGGSTSLQGSGSSFVKPAMDK